MGEIDADVMDMAKKIASLHGSAFMGHIDGQNVTVAARAGYGSWGHSADAYAKEHWRQYRLAAEIIVDTIKAATDQGDHFLRHFQKLAREHPAANTALATAKREWEMRRTA